MASAVDFEKYLVATLKGNAQLAALVGTNIFPIIIPQGTAFPCISYQRISGMPANTLSGHSGLEEIDLQIDVWAKTYTEAKAIAKAVRAAMPASGTPFSARLRMDEDLPGDDGTYFRVSMEYTVWFLETE
jgi:hypothetical protein